MSLLRNVAEAAESVAGQVPHDWFGFAVIVFGGLVTVTCSAIAAWATVHGLRVNKDNAEITKAVKKQITNGQEGKNFRTEFDRRLRRIEEHLGIPEEEPELSNASE